jgi:hypothetical protein
MGIGYLFYFSLEVHLSSSTVVGSLSYYPPSVHNFLTIVIDVTSNNL